MRSLEEILSEVSLLVGNYEAGAFVTKEKLVEMQRRLSSSNYFLTVIHVDYRKKHNAVIHNRPDGGSVASAKNKADVDFPEVDMTRKIMQAIEKVLISMSIEIKMMSSD